MCVLMLGPEGDMNRVRRDHAQCPKAKVEALVRRSHRQLGYRVDDEDFLAFDGNFVEHRGLQLLYEHTPDLRVVGIEASEPALAQQLRRALYGADLQRHHPPQRGVAGEGDCGANEGDPVKRKAKVRDHSWAKQIEAICVTVIREGNQGAVLDAFRADLASEHPAVFAEADRDWSEGQVVVQVWPVGKHLVVVEPNGFFGSLRESLLSMLQGRDAVSVFWNVNAHMRVLVAKDGEVVREFDPLMYDDGGRPLPEEAGLGFGDPESDVRGGALNLLERRLGVVLSEDLLLKTPQPTFSGRPSYGTRG